MAPHSLPEASLLRQLILCDTERGEMTWLPRAEEMFFSLRAHKIWNTRYAGKPALNCISPDGYKRGAIVGHQVLAHRVVWAIAHGDTELHIDHINGVPSDNRISNLRAVTACVNLRNQRMRSDNKSGHTGVSWDKKDKRWRAQIRYDGRNFHLGQFKTLDEAVECRKRASIENSFHANHGRKALSKLRQEPR